MTIDRFIYRFRSPRTRHNRNRVWWAFTGSASTAWGRRAGRYWRWWSFSFSSASFTRHLSMASVTTSSIVISKQERKGTYSSRRKEDAKSCGRCLNGNSRIVCECWHGYTHLATVTIVYNAFQLFVDHMWLTTIDVHTREPHRHISEELVQIWSELDFSCLKLKIIIEVPFLGHLKICVLNQEKMLYRWFCIW